MDTNVKERDVLTPDQALHILFKNKVKITGSEIKLPFSDEGPGIRVWSAIDCLVNRGTYFISRPERSVKKRKEPIVQRVDSSCMGSNSTGTLKRISNNVKYGSGELKDMKNLRESMIKTLFTTQAYELGKILTNFDLKVKDYA